MRRRKAPWLQVFTHVGALSPLAVLTWLFWQDQLGPVPVEAVIRRLGQCALVFLILSLVPTVIRTVAGFDAIMGVRRWLGLYAFLYGALHFLAFVGLDYRFDLTLIVQAIIEGRREFVGLLALTILGLLALTSVPTVAKRMAKAWKLLHRLVYLAGVLVVLHYVWNYKELRMWPTLAGVALLLLLAARLPPVADFLRRRGRQQQTTG